MNCYNFVWRKLDSNSQPSEYESCTFPLDHTHPLYYHSNTLWEMWQTCLCHQRKRKQKKREKRTKLNQENLPNEFLRGNPHPQLCRSSHLPKINPPYTPGLNPRRALQFSTILKSAVDYWSMGGLFFIFLQMRQQAKKNDRKPWSYFCILTTRIWYWKWRWQPRVTLKKGYE